MTRRAVVLLSGGLDSATVLAIARHEGYAPSAISFRYGQRHAHELECAKKIAERNGPVPHVVIDFDLRTFGGSALTADIDVPKERELASMDQGIPITYVPARNTIFLSFALAYAEVQGATDIFVGVNALDYSGYPDCRDDTIKAMQLALNLGMDRRFVLETPLMWLDKAATWAMASDLGGDTLTGVIRDLTHTCYLGDRSHHHAWGFGCGACPACVLRARGWEQWQAGIPAKTENSP